MALVVAKESSISYIVQLALEKLFSWMQKSAGLSKVVENELNMIKDLLTDIRDFSVTAEKSLVKDPKLMNLLDSLKHAAYDAQDMLEKHTPGVRGSSSRSRERGFFGARLRSYTEEVISSLKDVSLVKKLRERLEDLKEQSEKFQLSEKMMNQKKEINKQRETHSLVNESQVFGREREKEKIVNLLVSTEVGDGGKHENVSVIPIVGMAGLGKTTLAKLVFNDQRVKNHFKLKMWIYVSDDVFDVIKLGRTIIKRAIGLDRELEDMEELQHNVQKALTGETFLLVLDDVWNEKIGKWNKLKELLLCGGTGSKIVVTTRSPKVASIVSKMKAHKLESLSAEDCWLVFSGHAFEDQRDEEAYRDLVPIGREIVGKCEGNPLAVATLGGLLRFERDVCKWKHVRDAELQDLADDNMHGILPALRLSYTHLQPHLQDCFAFCAVFPRNYEIEKELLIKLWMAHGFIPPKSGMQLEDIGNEIFDELLKRCFFQVVTTKYNFSEIDYQVLSDVNDFPITVRIHDLLYDLAVSSTRMTCLSGVGEKGRPVLPCTSFDHVSCYDFTQLDTFFLPPVNLRTVIRLHTDLLNPFDFRRFPHLRVLDLSNCQWGAHKSLLPSLRFWNHLRYLNLSYSSIDNLPESLAGLRYLQTLILTSCYWLRELPRDMRNMTELRYLDIRDCHELTHMPANMRQLSCLRELTHFIVGRTDEMGCSGIEELKCLDLEGSLTIKDLKHIDDPIVTHEANLIGKPNLTSLHLDWTYFPSLYDHLGADLDVLQGLQPHQNLEKLQISNYGGMCFPSWMMDTTLTKLVRIILDGCWRCDVLPPLGQLPLLKVLKILRFKNLEYIGDVFYGDKVSGGFRSLQLLEIYDMPKLQMWSEWEGEGVFAGLVELTVEKCPRLTTMTCFTCPKDLSSSNTNLSLSSIAECSSASLITQRGTNLHQEKTQSLTNLKLLEISWCEKLEFLPVGLHNLTSLESMTLRHCDLLSFPDEDEIRGLSSLRELTIDSCDKLISSVKGIRYLISLKKLKVMNCNELVHLPNELSFLTGLQHLELSCCNELKSLSNGIGNLTSLQFLTISDCPELGSLPEELQHLTALCRLCIRGCSELKIRCEKNTGEDWHKIQHIPHIQIS